MLFLLIPVALVTAVLLNHYRPWIRRSFVNQTTSLTDAQIMQSWNQAVQWIARPTNPWGIAPDKAMALKPRAVYVKEYVTLMHGGHQVTGLTDGRPWMPRTIRIITACAQTVLDYEMQNLALMLAGKSTAGR